LFIPENRLASKPVVSLGHFSWRYPSFAYFAKQSPFPERLPRGAAWVKRAGTKKLINVYRLLESHWAGDPSMPGYISAVPQWTTECSQSILWCSCYLCLFYFEHAGGKAGFGFLDVCASSLSILRRLRIGWMFQAVSIRVLGEFYAKGDGQAVHHVFRWHEAGILRL